MSFASTATSLLLALAATATGCGDDDRAPPPSADTGPRRDVGPRDGGPPEDTGLPLDSGPPVDTGPPVDSGPPPDTGPPIDSGPGLPDTGPLPLTDAGPRPDAGPPRDAGPGVCGMLTAPLCLTDATCPTGTRCLDDGCGAMRCVPAGHACGDSTDCPMGSTCEMGATFRICRRASGCGDSRDCPRGFACEAGACVDRRIGCGPTDDRDVCPWGFVCTGSEYGTDFFCIRAYGLCATDAACHAGGRCLDITGAGVQRQCQIGGPRCQTNADCPVAGEVCGDEPSRYTAGCSRYGPCASMADCAAGFECLDLWGDGTRDCVPTGGTCRTSSECPARAVCAPPYTGGAPRCISTPL